MIFNKILFFRVFVCFALAANMRKATAEAIHWSKRDLGGTVSRKKNGRGGENMKKGGVSLDQPKRGIMMVALLC